jgi:hypothetical protein
MRGSGHRLGQWEPVAKMRLVAKAGIETGRLVVNLMHRWQMIEAEAEIERQALGNAPVVLSVYGQLADVPPELEWLANITNAKTRSAYRNDVAEFSAFTRLRRPAGGSLPASRERSPKPPECHPFLHQGQAGQGAVRSRPRLIPKAD